MDPTKRLLFWLRIPYAADVALALIGVGFLLAGRSVGWWVLLFTFVRAVIGTIALFWLAPKLIARHWPDDDSTADQPNTPDDPQVP
ncbi:MAG TPA: hypothetical protein VIJ18_13590 [Microbacteriaceae bacterium]